MNRLPRTVEELNSTWLTAALGVAHPGVIVKDMTIEKIIWGTATKVLVRATYLDKGTAPGLPEQLCIKGEFDERSRQAINAAVTGTEIEAAFFNDLAPRLNLPLTRHWYGACEPGMGILILDNLAVQGYRFGTPAQSWPADRVAEALDILAKLHASTWNKKFPDIRWLSTGSEAVRNAAGMLLSTAHWERHFAKPEVFKLPAALANNERLLNGYRALWRFDEAHADCIVHGDAHVANTCIDPAGHPFFIDWAAPCHSHWAVDVPYFMIGALSREDRRATEKDLFAHYLARVGHHGGPALDPAAAWHAYRLHVMHGMMWPTLPPEVQPIDYVHAMGERFCEAMAEHDTLNLLAV